MKQYKPLTLIIAALLMMLVALIVGCSNNNDTSTSSEKSKNTISAPKNYTKALPNAEYKIRLAYTDAGTWPNSDNKPLAEQAFALIFKNIVESKTNGQVTVELFPGNTMAQSKEATEMVQNGTLEMAITTGATAAFYPEIQVMSLPYVFQSDEIAWRVFDESEFWQEMVEDMAEKTNIRILGMGQNGTRHFTNSVRPIKTPDDMKGLKIRVMPSPIFSQMVTALGASPTPLSHNEIYTSCQTGVVDGQENPIWNIAANKWYEVQTYMTLDGHVWSENMLIINDNYFNNLPEEIQHVIKVAAWQGQWADRVAESLASRITDYQILDEHLEIYSPTPEEITLFKEAVTPVKEWLIDQIGAEVVDRFYAAVENAEQELGY